ncbi:MULTISPECIES: YwdI family protein [Lysinibacillus]|uniref:Uracil-DNA glycosylase n=1 Tax=Lysinibacillus fusiformis TaxID=28031 RepID=A0A1E4R2J3_9BACI|nr:MULTISPECIES: YwdI family protein [Lysinibacillus]ODV54690.1 uracil-DNA glycosylase [Lysinibacillus fusiformis]HBJ01943.1 uracil-DNA glycosylase [Lysinibacillus sp.]
MIPYQAVIQQLEKQLSSAKNAGNDQQIREALSAIRALCDVVLDSPSNTPSITPPSKHLPQMLVSEMKPSSLSTSKIEEDGANGDSIFDF